MPNILKEYENPVVDFDYFYFSDEDGGYHNTHKFAGELAVILMAYVNIDDLHGINDEEGVYYPSSVGTGGSGMNYNTPSVGAQRACLASHFASYAHRHYESCYLALAEYQCLKELADYLEDEYFPPQHREKLVKQSIELLNKVIRKFEVEYAKEVPGFLFTLLKNQK